MSTAPLYKPRPALHGAGYGAGFGVMVWVILCLAGLGTDMTGGVPTVYAVGGILLLLGAAIGSVVGLAMYHLGRWFRRSDQAG